MSKTARWKMKTEIEIKERLAYYQGVLDGLFVAGNDSSTYVQHLKNKNAAIIAELKWILSEESEVEDGQ